MLLYLSYDRNKKQWNKRIRFVGFLCVLAWLFFAFRIQPKQSNMLSKMMDYDLPKQSEGELNLLTYNIAGLPEMISSAKTVRAQSILEIGRKMNAYDLVNVQEDFNYNQFLYQDNTHPYRTAHMGGIPFGDGLSTLSKYPITHFERVAWADCNGADCLTPKGFTFAKIKVADDVFIDVYNIHATAANDKNAAIARQKNLLQLLVFMQEKSKGNPVLMMGDFNAHYSYALDNVKLFQERNNLSDAWVNLKSEGEFPVINSSFQATPMLELTEDCESIDKVFFRNSAQLEFIPVSYTVEKHQFSNAKGEDLSDHCAISMRIKWKLVDVFACK